jgi:hypothetical protein
MLRLSLVSNAWVVMMYVSCFMRPDMHIRKISSKGLVFKYLG